MSQTMSPPDAGGKPMGGGDDTGGASDADDNIVCTIASDGQGGYIVYAGDEPEGSDEGDMSEDDANAMGPAGAAPAPNGGAPPPQGQSAGSVGEALKIVMGILQDADSSGTGGAADQFAAGFTGSQAATPASGPMKQKY